MKKNLKEEENDIKSDRSAVECSWGSLKDHPKCPHGK